MSTEDKYVEGWVSTSKSQKRRKRHLFGVAGLPFSELNLKVEGEQVARHARHDHRGRSARVLNQIWISGVVIWTLGRRSMDFRASQYGH